MMRDVEIILVALIALAIGLSHAPVVAWLRRRTGIEDVLNTEPPRVHEQLAVALDVLEETAAVVVGPHDELFHANAQAKAFGVARGTRIAPDLLLDEVRAVRESGETRRIPLSVRQEIGVPVLEVRAVIAPLIDGMVLVFADDSSVRQRTDDIKRDFIANVSHELKTPVGAMRVLAEAVQQAVDDPRAVERFSERMISEADRLNGLVAQIIELSRLQSHDPLFLPGPVNLDEVLATAIDHCRELADARQMMLNVSGQSGLCLPGNTEQLVSAVENLVTNAITYSEDRARVAITTRMVVVDEESMVEIRVADNGIGISPEEQQRVFERFYRVDDARSRASGGSGLGLAIVKHIVGAHGGTISLWSSPGQGSTFTILLPALAAEPEVTAGEGEP